MVAKWYPRDRTAREPKPWYLRDAGARFQRDDAIVRAHYPGLEWKIDEATQLARLGGTVTILESGGIKTPVPTRVDFPYYYWSDEPVAFETTRRFVWDQDRHITPESGQCCLWLPPLSKWDPNDPNALHTFLDELAVFFDRQLVFESTGRWPGPSWGHSDDGYWKYVVEQLGGDLTTADKFIFGLMTGRNEPCPCGGGRHYKRCHLGEFEALARKIGAVELKRLRNWRERLDTAGRSGGHDVDEKRLLQTNRR